MPTSPDIAPAPPFRAAQPAGTAVGRSPTLASESERNVNEEHVTAQGALVGAVISTDPEFQSRFAEIVSAAGEVDIGLTVEAAFTAITDSHLERLRGLEADVVFVDLESDPHVGLKFSEFLIESGIARAVVGAGSADSPEILLRAMEAGVLEFLPKPLESRKVEGVIERLRRKTGKAADQQTPRQLGRLLSVFSPKGGSGATTFAVNLAVAIHQVSRKRTLIVDLDLELGETALLLGKDPRFSSVDLVRNYHRVDEGLLASYIERDESGVELLSAPYQPGDFGTVEGDRIGKILGFLKEQYDYVIVDVPKTLNAVTLHAFEASDGIFLLTTADLQSLRNVTRSLPLLQGLASGRDDNWIRLIVNRFSPSHPIPVSEVEKTLGMKVHWTLRNDYRAVLDSINEGRPAVLEGRSAYAENVRKLAADITGIQTAPKPRSRLFGGLVSALRNGHVDRG